MEQILILILGLFCSAYSYHSLQKVRNTKDFFISASVEFSKPFNEIKMIFDSNTTGFPENVDIRLTLIDYFSKQKRAIPNFEQILPKRFRDRISDAWIDYEDYINKDYPSNWFDFNNIYKSTDEIIGKRKIAIEKIDKILWFSDYHNIYSIF